MLDDWPVVTVVFDLKPSGVRTRLLKSIQISPRENYMLNLEILASGSEGIGEVRFDQKSFGSCTPNGFQNTDCNFIDCSNSFDFNRRYINSDTGSLFVSLAYNSKPNQCDCSNENANCGQNNELSNLKEIAAAARITLTPIGKKTYIQIYQKGTSNIIRFFENQQFLNFQ